MGSNEGVAGQALFTLINMFYRRNRGGHCKHPPTVSSDGTAGFVRLRRHKLRRTGVGFDQAQRGGVVAVNDTHKSPYTRNSKLSKKKKMSSW